MTRENQSEKILSSANKEEKESVKKPFILVIDDEESMRDSCCQILTKDGLLKP